MWFSDAPPPPRQPDEERLAEFGGPIYEFVPQPRLQLTGWGTQAENGTITQAEPVYWVADAELDFHFVQYATGPFGTIFNGHVNTSVPGSIHRAGDPVMAALTQFLSHHVVNYEINQPDFTLTFASPEYQAQLRSWRDEVDELDAVEGSFVAEDVTAAGSTIRYRGFTATAAALGPRIVTLVCRDDDVVGIDLRLTRHR